jgi:hypothetical protein
MSVEIDTVDHRAKEISDAMSKAERPMVDAFKPMEMAHQPKPEPEPEYKASREDLRRAGRDLQDDREVPAEIIPREYKQVGGPHAGERSPLEQTRTAEQAAADLAALRRGEADRDDVLRNRSLQGRLDAFRQSADAEDRGQVEAAQRVPEPQPEVPQHEAPQQTNGVDPEVRRLIEQNPKLREAIAQEAQMTHAVQQQYGQAISQAHSIAVSPAIESFPEIAGPHPQAALEQLRQTNPARYSEVVGRLQKIQAISNHMQQQHAHQFQQTMAQWQANGERHDQEYMDYASTRPAAENKAVKENLLDVMRAYGINEREFGQMYNMGHPWARSGIVQRIFHDLTVLHVARQQAAHKAPAQVGRVMRPGDAVASGTDNSALAAAMRAFAQDANPKSAARALIQRRKAASALR